LLVGVVAQNLTDDPVIITVKVSGFYEKLFSP
jgi:hypothetical protein